MKITNYGWSTRRSFRMLPGLGGGHPPTEEACGMPHTVEPGYSRRNLTTVDGS
jgi:hypothetical protein